MFSKQSLNALTLERWPALVRAIGRGMAETNKTTFLGAINPWSRSSTPAPKSPKQLPKDEPPLKQGTGLDHAISVRPSPSAGRYPKDCPPNRIRWFYATNIAKRKPLAPEPSPEEKEKLKAVARKWVLFSEKDSKAIESAFQQLGIDDEHGEKSTTTKVPVNEDYLWDVHIEKRELEPAYWIGPIHDVIRGSWFYADNTPCDENLANQLEEGYLKVTPWRKIAPPRSSSRPPPSESNQPRAVASTAETPPSNTYRLFGAHMNTTATYYDATTAYMSFNDFMSRMSNTVYGKLGGQIGTKVVRGYTTPINASAKPADQTSLKEKRRSIKAPIDDSSVGQDDPSRVETEPTPMGKANHRPSALERQLSSLAGITRTASQDEQRQQDEEQARVEEEQEMENARENDGEDQGRRIDHLILVTHGIGQRLGLRLDSINFVHDVNTMRKTMKAVFNASPDLQALTDNPKNCTIQILPICWRHLLDFPKQSLRHNRKEYDLGDIDTSLEDEYPSLQDITVDGVPAVRNLITDLALDVLLYQSAYREHVARIVQKEANRVYQLFKARTGFDGRVSLCGHSLGSAIYFDILCRQSDGPKMRPRRVSSRTHRESSIPHSSDINLDFHVDSFFALGSPIALFQMLKGRTVAGRPHVRDAAPPMSPFDPDPMQNNPFSGLGDLSSAQTNTMNLPITTSSPKCSEFFNIFHPTDPIAYRIEPLISPAMSSLKAQPLPYTKRGLFAAPGMANLTARVSQQVISGWYNLTSGVASSLINRSLGITGEEQALPSDKPRPTSSQYQVSSTNPSDTSNSEVSRSVSSTTTVPPLPVTEVVATSNKQKALAESASKSEHPDDIPALIDTEIETLYEGFQKRRRSQGSVRSTEPTDLEYELEQEKARRLKREEAKVRALNSNGRVDYAIQEGMFDVSLLASIASHLSYWADLDVNHFMVSQLLKAKEKDRKREEEKDRIVL